jgi:hypothetical protein
MGDAVKNIANGLLGSAFGIAALKMGYGFLEWQFWAWLFGLLALVSFRDFVTLLEDD